MFEKIIDIDKNIFLSLNFDGGPFMDSIMWYFSMILSYLVMVFIFFTLMRICRKSSYKELLIMLLFMGVIILLADQTSNFFKAYTPKFRPTHNESLTGLIHTVNGYVGGLYGTVSGHAANGFGLATFIALVYSRRWFTVSVYIYVSIIAYSRIYLGVHFPLDLIFGTIFGILYGRLIYSIYKKLIIDQIKLKD